MVEGVRLTREELLAQFSLSQRAVIRIGALQASKVFCSRAVVELCQPNTPAEEVLLSAELLAAAGELTTQLLKEFCAKKKG